MAIKKHYHTYASFTTLKKCLAYIRPSFRTRFHSYNSIALFLKHKQARVSVSLGTCKWVTRYR